MKIVADENIPGLHAWGSALGNIELVPGRRLSRERLHDATVVLVRSVTRVNAALLEQTPVRFVGSATSGVDHVDLDYLTARGIVFASAPGCNAVAVAEYVLGCGLLYAIAQNRSLIDMTVGVIGHGHAGDAVVKLLSALGVRCLVNDPPRAALSVNHSYLPLEVVLQADIVTLHVPLTNTGHHPTHGLINADRIAALAPHAMLINAARGGVLVEKAWPGAGRRLVLDCWTNEPFIDPNTLSACWMASPHIAGHTVDARLRGTTLLTRQLAAFLGVAAPRTPPLSTVALRVPAGAEPAWARAVLACCDPRPYTAAMRTAFRTPAAASATRFDELRKQCGMRREFAAHEVTDESFDPASRRIMEALGFTLTPC